MMAVLRALVSRRLAVRRWARRGFQLFGGQRANARLLRNVELKSGDGWTLMVMTS